jgi:hypothetical protein
MDITLDSLVIHYRVPLDVTNHRLQVLHWLHHLRVVGQIPANASPAFEPFRVGSTHTWPVRQFGQRDGRLPPEHRTASRSLHHLRGIAALAHLSIRVSPTVSLRHPGEELTEVV